MSIRLRWSSRLGLVAVALLGIVLPHTGAGRADAQPAVLAYESSGPGYCTSDDGVTVVVDLTALDGPVVVRCVEGPLPASYSGWDALEDAGFNPQMPSRTPGFICRLAGEPTASRSLAIAENDDYHERCVNTPPTSAYWGYWYAKNGGGWSYSTSSAAGHRVVKGGFEGWAFSLNSGDRPPKPGVAPSHPVKTPQPQASATPNSGGSTGTDNKPTNAATSSVRPGPTQTGDPATDKPSGRPDDGGAAGTTTSSAAGPTSAPRTSEGLVTGEVPVASTESESSGSPLSTVLGIGVLLLLAAGAGVTAWRRSHRV
jgi:hypothetical protein